MHLVEPLTEPFRGMRRRLKAPRGRDILDTVLAESDQPCRLCASKQRGDILFRLRPEGKHPVNAEVVVERNDCDRQVFAQGLEIDRHIGGNGRFTDAALFTGNSNHKKTFHVASPEAGVS